MRRHALWLILAGCAASDPFAGPDPQSAAARAILEGPPPLRGRAIELLRTSERCELSELDVRELSWREPKLVSELVWRWLRRPSIDARTAEILAPRVVEEGRRELVDLLRRVDPEHAHVAAVSRTPLPEDLPLLLKHLEFTNGIHGAAAGLVRLGDRRGLRPLLEEVASFYPESWGEALTEPLPEGELERRVAEIVLALVRSRFSDADLRDALLALDAKPRGGVHAVLAHRLNLRAELLRLAGADVKEAIRLLADIPGQETLDVLHRALKGKCRDAAMESMAMLGDPELVAHPEDAFAKELADLTKPLPENPRPLAEEGEEPLSVFADWSGRETSLLKPPHERVFTDPEGWAAFWKSVRRPVPPLDFGRHAALVIQYPDPDPANLSGFAIRVAGRKGAEVRVVRCRQALGFHAVDHAGTSWRVLAVPRSSLPLRVRVEDVVR